MKSGNKIKAARALIGLSQTQLAKKIGKPQSWVSAVENGGIGDARLADVVKLCKILGLTLAEVTDW